MQRFEGLMLHVPQDQVSALREPVVRARLSVVERGPICPEDYRLFRAPRYKLPQIEDFSAPTGTGQLKSHPQRRSRAPNMRTERPRALELVLAGAASLALLCLVHSVRGVTARTELADVSAGLPNEIPAT
jgi:hypothetical protein